MLRIVFALFVVSIMGANLNAQESNQVPPQTVDCLVRLTTPDPNFTIKAQGQSLTVLSHSSNNASWHVRAFAESCKSLHTLTSVAAVETPVSLILTLKEGESVPEKEIEALGGIVEREFQNLSAASVVVPAEAVGEISKLPAILRVRKDRTVSTNTLK